MGKTIVIGDIHGCINTITDMIKEVGLDKSNDVIIFLGDYIDRGFYSIDVIKYLRDIQSEMGNRCICLRGNHEQMAVESILRNDRDAQYTWYNNGAQYTLWSYRNQYNKLIDDIEWMNKLSIYYRTDSHIFCHAGLKYPNLDDNTNFDLMWDRSWRRKIELKKTELPVVFGHTPNEKGITHLSNGNICLDGGCVFGGFLCALIIYNDGTQREIVIPTNNKDIDKQKHDEVYTWWYNN